jgi:hypothetical protein
VLDAGDEDAGGLAGGVEFALFGGFFEEAGWLVAAGFGVGEDAGGVVGDGGA